MDGATGCGTGQGLKMQSKLPGVLERFY